MPGMYSWVSARVGGLTRRLGSSMQGLQEAALPRPAWKQLLQHYTQQQSFSTNSGSSAPDYGGPRPCLHRPWPHTGTPLTTVGNTWSTVDSSQIPTLVMIRRCVSDATLLYMTSGVGMGKMIADRDDMKLGICVHLRLSLLMFAFSCVSDSRSEGKLAGLGVAGQWVTGDGIRIGSRTHSFSSYKILQDSLVNAPKTCTSTSHL